MPKINVDLPEELAKQVRARELPVSAICQRALRAEISHLQTIEQAVGIIVQVGDPTVDIGFTGRWLVEPDTDKTRAGLDEGAYWASRLPSEAESRSIERMRTRSGQRRCRTTTPSTMQLPMISRRRSSPWQSKHSVKRTSCGVTSNATAGPRERIL
jgi:hypothetical protein